MGISPGPHNRRQRSLPPQGVPEILSHGSDTAPQTCFHRLHGSYEVMRGGHMNEAFVDFTGGVGEVLYLRQNASGLFAALRHALAKESLVGATALVRESDAPGDPPSPEHSLSWRAACPMWASSLLSLSAYSLS